MLNIKLLKSKMILKDVNTKALADAQGWSKSTAYRKINGKVAWTAPEIQVFVDLLKLSADEANAIFFAAALS